MTLSFVSIDFETANSFRGSPCSIGMIRIVDGHIESEYARLIRPPIGYDSFDPWNIMIHGITPKDVKTAKRFGEQWPEILDFIGGLPLVAHNAGFDLGVIREALRVSDITWPELKYACTMVMSRRMYEIPSHTLSFVAEAAGISWDENLHHEAKYDAIIAAHIAVSMANSNNCETLDELLTHLNVGFGRLTADGWVGCRSKYQSSNRYPGHSPSVKEVEVNVEADESHPLFGKQIAFTGTLHSMPRIEAWKAVAFLGGIPQDTVTKETNILVIGEQELSKLRPGESQSSKFSKAAKLKSLGQEIEVMTERDFLSELEMQSGSKSSSSGRNYDQQKRTHYSRK